MVIQNWRSNTPPNPSEVVVATPTGVAPKPSEVVVPKEPPSVEPPKPKPEVVVAAAVVAAPKVNVGLLPPSRPDSVEVAASKKSHQLHTLTVFSQDILKLTAGR